MRPDMTALVIALVSLASQLTAFGGVFDDAAFYFNANSLNTSGKFATGDLPDRRYVADPDNAINKAKVNGTTSCVQFRDEAVVHPFANVTNVERCLYLTKTHTGEGADAYCTAGAVTLPDLFNVTNAAEFTVVMRLRWDGVPDEFDSSKVARSELIDLGLNGTMKSGYFIAVDRSDGRIWVRDGSHNNTFYLGSSGASYGLVTNVWTDLSISHGKDSTGKWAFQLHLFDTEKNVQNGQWRSASCYNADSVLAIASATNSPFRIGAVDSIGNGARKVSSNSAGARAFAGSISQLAIWPRALSKAEVAEAFGGNALKFEMGVENGKSSEFGGTGSSVVANVTNDWYSMPPTLTSERSSVTINYVVPAHEAGLPQILRFVPTSGSAQGFLTVKANGVAVGTESLVSGKPLMFWIDGKNLLEGSNALTLEWSGLGTLGIDAVSLGGSWCLGIADKSTREFNSTANRYQSDYYLNPPTTWKRFNPNVQQSENYSRNTIHFSLPSSFATNGRYRVEIPCHTYWSANGEGGLFSVAVNGDEKVRVRMESPSYSDWGKLVIDLGEGVLRGGENTIQLHNVNDVGATEQYDYVCLRAKRPPTGLMIIFR